MSLAEQLDSLLSEDLATVRERESSALDRILAECGGRCVLFGAGSLGRSVLRCLARDGIQPLAIADNNPALWHTSIDGVPVLPPADAARLHGTEAAFFVTIWREGHRYAEPHEQLVSLGVSRVFPVAALRWKYSCELLPFLCQDLPHKVYEERELVTAAFHLWADDRSRDQYLRQIRYRALGDYLGMTAPDRETSYFPGSLYSLRTDEVFVDCGAYDGDTIRELLRRCGNAFARIVAVEPDAANFVAIERYLKGLHPEVARRIQVHLCAVADRTGQICFSSGGDTGSAISAGADTLVDAARLDDLIRDVAPTFIKMDIEGAEVDALNGARRLITWYHPLLAICLYHRQNDLWRIPLLIHSIHPGYRFFLRAHEADGWQTVGYAIPPERLREGDTAPPAATSHACLAF